MTSTLVQAEVAAKWDTIHAKGSDKSFPNLDLVRLEKWFFGSSPGKLLEYGFGCGVNLLHLLECGYDVDAVDASIEAKKFVASKISKKPALQSRVRLHHISAEAGRIDFPEKTFDQVVCISVLSLLGSRQSVDLLLQEFARVMKPKAKIILDINGPESDFARQSEFLGEGVYVYRGSAGKESPIRCYCPSDADAFASQVASHFAVDDIGYSGHRYFQSHIQEFIVCAHKE